MKIATITCHHVYNYGATLQAYALQKYLISLGHEAELINYIPWYHNRYSFWMVNKFSSHYNLINRNILLKLLWCLKYNLPYILKEYKRKRAFDKFDSKYLKISKKKYSNITDLKKFPPPANAYICGSDQIWSPNATYGIEKAYYLDFGKSNTYRISYAASFGSDAMPDDANAIRLLLQNFKSISVREDSGKQILKKMGFKVVDIVLDPAFLLNATQWKELSANSKRINTPEKYILLYNFKNNSDIQQFVLKLQSLLNIPILCIHGYDDISYADIRIKDAGPLEFLTLINNAEVIVSDSFHATVFSIIFNREFYTFSLKGQDNTVRMANLLDKLRIKNRLNVKDISPTNIDYKVVFQYLTPMIESSKDYLNNCLSSI